MAVGRISGPLLKSNLLRDGVDLAFETDLLYLDVNNGRVGIKTSTPNYDLDVNGTVRSTNAIIDTQITIATFTVSGNTIASSNSIINLEPSGVNAVVYQGKLQVNSNLQLTTNAISTTVTDADLAFNTLGTGQVNINSNTLINGNAQVTGNITSAGYLQLPQIRIENNIVSTTVTDTDLELQANGLGNVVFENIKVSDNNIQSISTNSNIILTPQGTGNVIINNTQSLQIPVGNGTTDRPDPPHGGMIRFNSDLNQYEGYNGIYWQALSGVTDKDGNTKIIAEATPGANDNTLYFYADGNLMVTIDTTKLFAERIQTSNMDLSGNTITSIIADSDLNLTATGTGGVRLGNLRIYNNSITNIASNAVTSFTNTGTGYVKFSGTNGIVLPSGDDFVDRPSVTEIGMTRFNTTGKFVEVFNGVSWDSVAGTASGATAAEAEDLGIASALILG